MGELVMKNKLKQKLILVAFGLLGHFAPCAYADEQAVANTANPSNVVVRADNSAAHRGTLYRVRHNGNTSYLFGTIHVGKAAFYPLGSEVMQAFSTASTLALELDLQDAVAIRAGVQKYGFYGADDALNKHLPPATQARLEQMLKREKLPADSIRQVKPWLVADALMVEELSRYGYDRNQGIEEFLLTTAQQQKKKVIGLETADFQFSLFNRLSDEEQVKFLDEAMDDISNGKMRTETDELADAWYRADAKALARLAHDELDEKSVSAEFTRHVLLDMRNPGMADKIEDLLKQDKVTFVGVGLLHLVGEKSVPELLRQRGYAVERIY
jgi:uncharacterized protein YbaP (TraB family)